MIQDFLLSTSAWSFVIGVLIDAFAIYKVRKSIKHYKSYLILNCVILTAFITKLIYFMQGELYNFFVVGWVSSLLLICKVLLDIKKENEERVEQIISDVEKTSRLGKPTCELHVRRLATNNKENICINCPLR